MKTRELVTQHNRLIDLFKKTEKAAGGDFEAQAHWAKYLCVLSAGFLENALREIYRNYCDRSSSPNVARFMSKVLQKVYNPKASRFLEIAGRFQGSWRESLKQFMEVNGRNYAIDSIMENRHQIAHGKDSGITLVRVKEYLAKSIEVVEFIEKQCNN